MTLTTSWNPACYAKHARFVSELGEPLLELLAPQPGERILDLGCGDGALTEKISARGCRVYGADASFAQVEAARRRGLNAFATDARQIAVKKIFDGVFTNAVLHWIQPPEKVVESVRSCLKPGGRFVGELGGKGNVDTIRTALHSGLRRRAIDRAVDFVTERLNGEDGLGAIFPAMANATMMYDVLGDKAHAAIARDSIDKLLVIHDHEAYCQPCVSPIWDTALACHALLETGDTGAHAAPCADSTG